MKMMMILGLLLSSLLQAGYSQNLKVPSVAFDIKIDKDFGAMQRNCQWCHSFGYILNQGKLSKESWHKIVVKMREVYKAPITKEDEKTTTEYLFKHYGNAKLK